MNGISLGYTRGKIKAVCCDLGHCSLLFKWDPNAVYTPPNAVYWKTESSEYWAPTLFAVTCSKPEDCGEETPLCRKFVKGGSQTCRVSHLNFKRRNLQADYFKTFPSDFQCQNGTPTRAIFSRKFHHKKILVGLVCFSSFWYSKSGETVKKNNL